MTEKTSIPKIKRYSNNLQKVINVFYWFSIALEFVSILAVIIIYFISNSHFILTGNIKDNFRLMPNGLIGVQLSQLTTEDISVKKIYIAIMLSVAIILLFIIPILKQLVLILKTVEEDKPFATENTKRISMIGVILILSSCIFPLCEVFVANTIINTLHLQNIDIFYSVNITLVFSGLLMFILSGIFDYGNYLQREYDETV